MAITYSSGAGNEFLSYAMDETLGSQTLQTGNNTVVVSDDIVTAGNGQIGDGTTGTGPGTTYVGRLLHINRGQAGEQIRYCIAEEEVGSPLGPEFLLTVGEDWDTNPAQNDTIHVPYTQDDAETGLGSGGVTYNTRTGFFEWKNENFVGDLTGSPIPAAGLQVLGELMEVEDSKSTTIYGLEMRPNGTLYIGYKNIAGDIGVQGSYITGINNSASEPWILWSPGSSAYLYDARLIATITTLDINVDPTTVSPFIMENFSVYQGIEDFDVVDNAYIVNGSFLGNGGGTGGAGSPASQVIRLIGNSFGAGSPPTTGATFGVKDKPIFVGNCDGITSWGGDTGTETLTIRDVTFSNNTQDLIVYSNKTWDCINPLWLNTKWADFLWAELGSSTNIYINDRRSVDVIVRTPAGTNLQGALVIVYEGRRTGDLELVLSTDANGEANDSFIYKQHEWILTTTFGNHALRVFDYTYVPFIATQTLDEKVDRSVALTTDSAISEQSQATAITNGSGITPIRHAIGETDPRPMKVFNYDAGNGITPTVGETITQAGSPAATGDIVDYIGTGVSGTIVLENWNGIEFTDNQSITASGSPAFSATTDTAGFYEEYTWEIDCNSKSLQVVYDYMAAQMANLAGSPVAPVVFEQLHEWGNDQQAQAIYSNNGYFTERSLIPTLEPAFRIYQTVPGDSPLRAAFMATDGTKMYVLQTANDLVYEYTLSTAWDVSTAAVGSPGFKSFSVTNEETAPTDITFKPDGTKFYIVGTSTQAVIEYTLSTPWDITTAAVGSPIISFDISSEDGLPSALDFKPDGTKMYMIGYNNDTVYEYNLSTPWDITTAALGSPISSFYAGAEDNNPAGLIFNKTDGTTMYITGTFTSTVYEYNLSIAWDASTAALGSPVISYYMGDEDASLAGLAFKPDGTEMYVAGSEYDRIYQKSLGTGWDLSTINPSIGQGVWLSNRGAGSLSYMTSDGGTQFTAILVTIRVQGLSEAAAVKVIANQSKGTITTGDVIFEKLADADGVAEITDFNYQSAFGTGSPPGLGITVRCRASGLPAAAIQDDNGSYTDETTAANSAVAADMNLLPAVPVVNEDAYLFGHPETFTQMRLVINTAGAGSPNFTITWQYWSGGSPEGWTDLTGVNDGTDSFSVAGTNEISWTMPGDWGTTTINGQGPYYYVRAVYTAGAVATVPTGTRCTLDVTKYLPFVQDRIVDSSGLIVNADWQEDTIATF